MKPYDTGSCHEGAHAAGLQGGGGLRGEAAPQPRDSRGKCEPGLGQEARPAVLGRGRGEAKGGEPGSADWTRGRAAVTWVMESPKSRTRGQKRGLPLATASHNAMMPTAGRRGHAGYPGGADSGGAGPGRTPGRGEQPGMGQVGGRGACAVRSLRQQVFAGWIFFLDGPLGAPGVGFLWRPSESLSVLSDSLRPQGLYSPWDSPGQNTGVGCLSLLQGIFLNQGSNPGLPHCRRMLYQLSH